MRERESQREREREPSHHATNLMMVLAHGRTSTAQSTNKPLSRFILPCCRPSPRRGKEIRTLNPKT